MVLNGLLPNATTSSEGQLVTLETPAGALPITVQRSSRAKRIALKARMAKRDIVLVLPKRASKASALAFAQSRWRWIQDHLNRMPTPVDFTIGAICPLRGRDHRITASGRLRGRVECSVDETGMPTLAVPGDPDHIPRRLRDWLKAEAKADLTCAAMAYADQIGVQIMGITIRDTTSRWGSCSASGRLNFSWRLILAPPAVLTYLAAHEVAHLRHMNHGPRFWRLVAELDPHFERAEEWLKTHGNGLHRFG